MQQRMMKTNGSQDSTQAHYISSHKPGAIATVKINPLMGGGSNENALPPMGANATGQQTSTKQFVRTRGAASTGAGNVLNSKNFNEGSKVGEQTPLNDGRKQSAKQGKPPGLFSPETINGMQNYEQKTAKETAPKSPLQAF